MQVRRLVPEHPGDPEREKLAAKIREALDDADRLCLSRVGIALSEALALTTGDVGRNLGD